MPSLRIGINYIDRRIHPFDARQETHMKTYIRVLILLSCYFWWSQANAKIFRNAYVSFELPDKWDCTTEGTEWVCTSTYKGQVKEAMIIFTAKETGPSDSMSKYEEHLKQSRLLPNRNGEPTQSKIIHIKRRFIFEQEWVDGMHLGSEVANYYTRYLAGIKENVAVLVTFSAHLQHYTKYSSDFFRAVQSLRVVAARSRATDTELGEPVPRNEVFGPTTRDYPSTPEEPTDERSSPSLGTSKTVGLSLLGLSAVLFFFLRRKRS